MTAWLPLLVLLPFREGSGSPEGLLVAHLALVWAAAFSSSAARRVAGSLLAASAFVLALASLSGALGPYRYASLLALVDLGAMLAVLLLVEARAARGVGSFDGLLLDAVAYSGIAQAGLVLVAWGPGTLLNPDHTAAYLLLAFWALVAGGEKAGGAAALRIIGGALLLGAVLLQASRGAFLALAAGGGVWIVLRLRALSPRAARAVLACAGVIVLLGALAIAHRFSTRDDPYRWDRVRLWKATLKVASASPLLGVGPGVFAHVSAPFDLAHAASPVRFGKHIEATHSDPLRIIAETGLLGFAAFLVLAVCVAIPCIRAIRRGAGVEAALAAGLAGLVAQALVENLSARPAVSYTGAALAALLAARGRRPENRPAGAGAGDAGAPPEPDPAARAGEPAGAERPERAAGASGVSHAGWTQEGEARPDAAASAVFGVLYFGGLAAAATVLVIAPYLGHHAFQRFRAGGADVGSHYAAALFWTPIHPEYRAALARGVLAAKSPTPVDFRAGFLAVDEAIVLKPIDPEFHLLKARLAKRALLAGAGEHDWVVMAEDEYANAHALDPLRPNALLERGWMRVSIGDRSGALSDADAALRSEPNLFEARRLRAVTLAALHRGDEARAEVAEARRRRESIGSYAPTTPYEVQVLRWQDEAWAALSTQLAGG